MQALDKLNAAELVEALDSPGPWQRDTIQQQIVTAKMQEAVPYLTKLVATSQRPTRTPWSRIRP